MSDHQDTLDLLNRRKGKDPGLTLAQIEGFLRAKLGLGGQVAAPAPEPEPESAPRRRRRP